MRVLAFRKRLINKTGEKEETVDMCKALQDLYDEGIEKGIAQGIEQGIEKGIAQGIEQGIEKGIEQGMREGAETERMEIARRLLGILDMQTIAEKVGLTKEQVHQLEEQPQ